jgi:PAS domain S-box-containing protein
MNTKELLAKEPLEPEMDKILEESLTPQNGLDERQFYDSALAKFGSILRWQEGATLKSWSENLLEELVPFVGGLQGALYYTDNERKEIVFASAFAIDFESNIRKRYRFGEGLIGQVATNQEMMILSDGNEFVSLTSTKKIRLKCIMMIPLIYNYRTVGVMEVNFPQAPTEPHHKFLTLVVDSIASNLNALVKEQELEYSFLKIQANEERLKRLAEVTSEGIVLLDNDHKIIEFNQAFEKIFGYSEAEIKGKNLLDFIKLEHEELEAFFQNIKEDIPFESIGTRKDGSSLDIEVQEKEMGENNAFLHIVSIRDITKRKTAEANLKVKEAELAEAQRIVELSEIIKIKNKNITSSINYAKRIQDALLPESQEINSQLGDYFIFFRPRDIVSGDFYWITQEGDKTVVASVDCTGHGVPGAIMSIAGSVFLKQIVNLQEITSPDEILTRLHHNISKSLKQAETRNRDGMDASICVIDKKSGVMEFAGAKNGLIYFQNDSMHEVDGDSFPVGGFWNKMEKNRIFKKKVIDISSPTTCYLYTDGYEDQFGGPEGKKFMKTRFRELLKGIWQKPLDEQKDLITTNINQWMQQEKQIDDMLIIGFRI